MDSGAPPTVAASPSVVYCFAVAEKLLSLRNTGGPLHRWAKDCLPPPFPFPFPSSTSIVAHVVIPGSLVFELLFITQLYLQSVL